MSLIAGMMSGLGEGLGKAADIYAKHFLQQQAEEADKARMERLAELTEQANIRAEARKREPYKQAAAAAQQAISGATTYDEASGTPVKREPTGQEQTAIKARAYEEAGLPEAASQLRTEALTAEGLASRERQHRETLASQKELTGMHIASAEKIAQMHNALQAAVAKMGRDVQLQIAKLGVTPQTLPDGRIALIDKQGLTTFARDPETGNALHGTKDLSATQKVAADILRDQLKALDAAEVNSATMPDQIPKIQQLRSGVNAQLLSVLSGDVSGAFKAPKVEPSERDVAVLRANAKKPEYSAAFDQKFGQGAAARYLQGGTATPAKQETLPSIEEATRMIGVLTPLLDTPGYRPEDIASVQNSIKYWSDIISKQNR